MLPRIDYKSKGLKFGNKKTFVRFLQLPFKQIKLISKFDIKYQKGKKKVQGLMVGCQISINQFPSIHFSIVSQIYSQWENHIEVHTPHLFLCLNYEDSQDEERMPTSHPDTYWRRVEFLFLESSIYFHKYVDFLVSNTCLVFLVFIYPYVLVQRVDNWWRQETCTFESVLKYQRFLRPFSVLICDKLWDLCQDIILIA